MPPPSASSGAESWVVGSVTTISSASMPTTYTTLPRPSHLTTPPSYQQPCGTEDVQYNELLLSGAVSTSSISHHHNDTITHSPNPHLHHHHHQHDPTAHSPILSHHHLHHQESCVDHSPTHPQPTLEDTRPHYPHSHQQHPSYTHPLAAVAATSPIHTVHTPTPPILSGRPQAGQPKLSQWSPSSTSIGGRHSIRREHHLCDTEATVPLMTSQKESSV
ncbi:hypothetical protein OTU49_010680 [Cherax quadricarinatus]|uniref:Uncharacterized protein n=1 Tax=Cherax quadricarinatus TaxID=27406 RepID=A0AAW0WDZ6_CHEQU